MFDPNPRVVFIAGVGLVAAASKAKEAGFSRAYRAIAVMRGAYALGGYVSLTDEESYAVEYWPLELYEPTLAPPPGEPDHEGRDRPEHRLPLPPPPPVAHGLAREESCAFFADRNCRPSVDRARSCGYDPGYAQPHSSDYVCSLTAQDVRDIDTVIRHDEKGVPRLRHNINVEPAPLPSDAAHAEIYAVPEISGGRLFERLLERSAYLARWEDEVCGAMLARLPAPPPSPQEGSRRRRDPRRRHRGPREGFLQALRAVDKEREAPGRGLLDTPF